MIQQKEKKTHLCNSSMGHTVPWSGLHVDLLFNVLSPLESSDLHRVSAVCRSFHHAVSLWHRQSQHQPPWIMLNSCNDGGDESHDGSDEIQGVGPVSIAYYSLSEERIYKIPIPEPCLSWHTIGSWHGWLVTADEQSDLHLINPLSKTHIPLPPVKTLVLTPDLDDDDEDISWYDLTCQTDDVDQLWRQCYKVVLSCDSAEDNFIAVIIHGPNRRLSFAKKGDLCWTLLDTACYKDCLYYEGLFYTVTEKGGIITWDLTDNKSPTCEVLISDRVEDDGEDDGYQSDLINDILSGMQLILAPWGGIILVRRGISRTIHNSHICEEVAEMIVYKLDIRRRKLLEINDMENYALFVGGNSGCFSTTYSAKLRANCVYFIDHVCRDRSKKIGLYDLSKGIFEYLPFCNCRSNFEPHLWISPN